MGDVRSLAAIGVVVALLAATVPAAAVADEKFPARALTVVVPYDAGGSLDLHVRAIAPALERLLGQPIGVVNRPGATGAVGFQVVGRGRADGYTIVGAPIPIVTIPVVDKLFERPPAFTTDLFAPLALLSADPLVAVVQASSPWKTLADLVADARKRPEAVKYPSPGPYGSVHLATELLAQKAGVKLTHVPFTGVAPALSALLGGHVEIFMAPPVVAVAQIRSGKLRALGVTGSTRHPELPEVPTLEELGYPNEVTNWYGLFAPRATPPAALAAWRDALDRASKDPQFVQAMAKIKTPIDYRNHVEFQKYLDVQTGLLTSAIQKIGKVN
ncbi:MAG: tripartite tricarboxylate transporter substrate binding protein [candidate division NC10 bacterium]